MTEKRQKSSEHNACNYSGNSVRQIATLNGGVGEGWHEANCL